MADRCGTDRGWWVHRQHGQDPCDACEYAHGSALIEWAAAREQRAESPDVDDEVQVRPAPKLVRAVDIPVGEKPDRFRTADPHSTCGTVAGFLVHQYRIELACARCTAAWAKLGASPITGYHNAGTLELKPA